MRVMVTVMTLLRWGGQEHGDTAKAGASEMVRRRCPFVGGGSGARSEGSNAGTTFSRQLRFCFDLRDPAQEHGAKEAPLRPLATGT